MKAKKNIILICMVGLLLLGLVGCNKKKDEVSPTVLWFNGTYAVLTELNGGDYKLIGGQKADQENKEAQIQSLEEWWGVTDRQSADESLEWVISEGHRILYADEMESLEMEGTSNFTYDELAEIFAEYFESEEEGENLARLYTYYINNKENGISAWDYSRALSLLGWYYLSGYYTKEEAMDKSLEVAQIIQEEFSSWDEFMESYFMGYEYWNNSSSDERRAIYDNIKSREDSPYKLDWNLTLEKDW